MAITSVKGVCDTAEQYQLNHMNGAAQSALLGDKVFCAKRSFVGKYDYAVSGGAVSTINLLDSKGGSLKLPANFIITNVIFDRVTSPGAITSGTISFGINSTADILAALNMTAYDSGTTAGTLLAGIPVGTAATAIKVTAEAAVTVTIATTALTAGKVYVGIEGYQSRSF